MYILFMKAVKKNNKILIFNIISITKLFNLKTSFLLIFFKIYIKIEKIGKYGLLNKYIFITKSKIYF
jgi:hypothetical protein